MKYVPFFLLMGCLFATYSGHAQSNEFIPNSIAEAILLGDYAPSDYAATEIIDGEQDILTGLVDALDRDKLVELLLFMDSFYNRNTGSDTMSLDTGIGACRDWILSYFDLISRENENRLVTGFLEFDADVCGSGHHKNPFAILPGRDTSLREILVVEGHFDTRNEDGCDTEGYTPGSDDNGSGTVLVMEAARLMAKYTFDRTILFTTPTGEDQGLWGAKAWANYLSDKGIEVKACLNNDIVGGITCGRTSSPPSCPYEGHVDSTHVRIFSYSPGNSARTYSPHKQLARLIKILQEERINPLIETPMTINIMASEDRTGRSGDHIPFRQKGFPAIRFCSANEHGNGRGDFPDRVHSPRDVLGQDLDGDGVLDTLFVDPGYLGRNLLSNCVTLSHLANATNNNEFSFYPVSSGVRIEAIDPDPDISGYRIGVRYLANRNHDFDDIHLVGADSQFEIKVKPSSRAYISVAPIKNGFFGMFSEEYDLNLMGTDPFESINSCRIQSVYPNPAQGSVLVEVMTGRIHAGVYQIQISDMTGRIVKQQSFQTQWGRNEVALGISDLSPGFYLATLADGDVRSMPFRFIKSANH